MLVITVGVANRPDLNTRHVTEPSDARAIAFDGAGITRQRESLTRGQNSRLTDDLWERKERGEPKQPRDRRRRVARRLVECQESCIPRGEEQRYAGQLQGCSDARLGDLECPRSRMSNSHAGAPSVLYTRFMAPPAGQGAGVTVVSHHDLTIDGHVANTGRVIARII